MPKLPQERFVREVIRDEISQPDSHLAQLFPMGGTGFYAIANGFRLQINDCVYLDRGLAVMALASDGSDARVIRTVPWNTNDPKVKAKSDALFIPNETDGERYDLFGLVFDRDYDGYTFKVIKGDESEARQPSVRIKAPASWSEASDFTVNVYYNFDADGSQQGSNYFGIIPGQSISDIQTMLTEGEYPFSVTGLDWSDFTFTYLSDVHVQEVDISIWSEVYTTKPYVEILDRGSSGNGDAIYASEAGIDNFILLAHILNPAHNTSWGAVSVTDRRYIISPPGLWNGGTVDQYTLFKAGFDIAGSGSAYEFRNGNSQAVLSWQTDYPGESANDQIGIFGQRINRASVPEVNVSAMDPGDLQNIARALASFGLIIDTSA